jgi:hypothetical protein
MGEDDLAKERGISDEDARAILAMRAKHEAALIAALMREKGLSREAAETVAGHVRGGVDQRTFHAMLPHFPSSVRPLAHAHRSAP